MMPPGSGRRLAAVAIKVRRQDAIQPNGRPENFAITLNSAALARTVTGVRTTIRIGAIHQLNVCPSGSDRYDSTAMVTKAISETTRSHRRAVGEVLRRFRRRSSDASRDFQPGAGADSAPVCAPDPLASGAPDMS